MTVVGTAPLLDLAGAVGHAGGVSEPRSVADAVIVGGGVIGCSIALELSRGGRRVVVVDKGPAAGAGSTSSSSAVVRFHYSTLPGVVASWDMERFLWDHTRRKGSRGKGLGPLKPSPQAESDKLPGPPQPGKPFWTISTMWATCSAKPRSVSSFSS